MDDLDIYLISRDSTIKDAMKTIEINATGAVVLTDMSGRLAGVISDGDIRRHLLKGGRISDNAELCANLNCFSVNTETPLNVIIKRLETGIKLVPVTDAEGLVTEVFHKGKIATTSLKRKFSRARARAPVRISFSGGGSDVTPYILKSESITFSSTINLFSHASIEQTPSRKIRIFSKDLNSEIEIGSLDELSSLDISTHSLALPLAIISILKPQFGFNLEIYSDYPVKSGLGGSSSIACAIIGCFNELLGTEWDKYEIAEIAYQAERMVLGIDGGWQDQYACAFGGFNIIELTRDKNVVTPIRLVENIKNELEENLVLCFTGMQHNSGEIQEQFIGSVKEEKADEILEKGKTIAKLMKDSVLLGHLSKFGTLLDETWNLKRNHTKITTNSWLDEFYLEAVNAGATGGKLLGAGGGGCFLFFVDQSKKMNLTQFLEAKGIKYFPFQFEDSGLISWKVKNGQNNVYG